jgi:hypothetical protein
MDKITLERYYKGYGFSENGERPGPAVLALHPPGLRVWPCRVFVCLAFLSLGQAAR